MKQIELLTPSPRKALPSVQLIHGDCLDVMPTLPARSIDCVMADLPYGTTKNLWDRPLPMTSLWANLKRLTRGTPAYVFTAMQPFTSALVVSNLNDFRYCWVWQKTRPGGFLNAKRRPLNAHEDIVIFGRKCPYFPQGLKQVLIKTGRKTKTGKGSYSPVGNDQYVQTVGNYPRSIVNFANAENKAHPTQKPVALLEWLLKTYTNPGDTVLDPVMGSASTGVACLRTGRNFIGIEKDAAYFKVASDRIAAEQARLQGAP